MYNTGQRERLYLAKRQEHLPINMINNLLRLLAQTSVHIFETLVKKERSPGEDNKIIVVCDYQQGAIYLATHFTHIITLFFSASFNAKDVVLNALTSTTPQTLTRSN